MRFSLRARLVLAGALAVLLALGASAAGLSALFGAHVERRAIAEMTAKLDQVLAGLDMAGQEGAEGQLVMTGASAEARFLQPYSGHYWQITLPGQTLRSRSLWDRGLALPGPPPADGQIMAMRLVGPQDQTLLAAARQVILPARLGAQEAVAFVAIDIAEMSEARRAFVADLAPYMILLAGVLIAAGWVQITIGLRPLVQLRERVGAVRSDPEARMGAQWPVEVSALARELDGLLDARAVEVQRARMRAGDLAHGLKSPLQALMGEAARLRDKGAVLDAVEIEHIVAAMRRTVDRELARLRRQADGSPARSDLRHTVDRILAVLRKTPDGQRIAWSVDLPDGLWVALDQGDLSEALGAVLENAGHHARAAVRLTAAREDDMICLDIIDDGPGIPDAQREAMLARFARLDERGSGMGLAIADEIVCAAGGRISLSDARADPGHTPGLSVRLSLPDARATAPKSGLGR
jgi:signal transduction histidine kinase